MRSSLFALTSFFLAAASFAQPVVSGVVHGADAAPIAGARVDLRPLTDRHTAGPEPGPAASVATDEHGRFRLTAPAGVWRVVARHEGRLAMHYLPLALVEPVELPPVTLPPAGESTTLTPHTVGTWTAGTWAGAARTGWTAELHTRPVAVLEAGDRAAVRHDSLALSGRVVDTAHRRPIAGALVWSEVDPSAFTRTDAEGRYRLTAPRAGRFWLQVEAAGHLPRRTWITRDHLGGGRAPTVALPAAAAVAGRVVDAGGRPLAGVEVTARARAKRPYLRPDPADDRTYSDARGRLRLDRLEPDQRQVLTASRPGFADARVELRTPGSGEVGGAEIVLHPARRVHGRVLDADDRPVAGARVMLDAAGRPVPRPSEVAAMDPKDYVRTGADGRFAGLEAPAEVVTLMVLRKGFVPTVVRGLEVPAGTASLDLGTVVLVPGHALAGVVVDASGDGVVGAEIHLLRGVDVTEGHFEQITQEVGARRPRAVTGDDGRFVLGDLVAGERVHLLVRHDGHRSAWRRHVEIPVENDLTIRLDPAEELRGRIMDEAGEPIVEAGVEVSWRHPVAPDLPARRGIPESRGARSDEQGRFAVADLPPGEVTLGVFASGFVPAAPHQLELPAAEELVVTLARGAALTGRVTTRSGDPIPGFTISLEGPTAGRTDADGRYRVEGVPLGPATVSARHRHYGRRVVSVEIEDGVNELDLTFDDGVTVAGRVTDTAGEPIDGVRVELAGGVAFDHRVYRARSDTEGGFRLAPVTDGEYALTLYRPGYVSPEPAPRVVVAGEPVEGLEIVASPGLAVTGEIRGLDFDELTRVRVEAESATGASRPGRVRYDGRYEIRDLAAGDWLLRAVVGGGRRQVQARVTLAPGELATRRDLEFEPRLTLDGQVLHGGEPLAGARLALRAYEFSVERSATTDHEGRFRLEDLERGRYHLGLSHAFQHLVHNQDVEVHADHELTIDLRPARVAGIVRSAGDGAPVPGTLVLLRRQVELGGEENLLTTGTDDAGTFRFPRVPAGRYRLSVRKDGYAADEEEIEVAAGADERLEVEARPTHGVELAVRRADGSRPRHVDVAVYDAGDRLLQLESRAVDAEGTARLPTVPPGSWRLVVSAPGAAPVTMAAEVPGEPLPVVLPPAARLAVRVPSLATSDHIASLTLFGASGEAYRGFDELVGLREIWPLVAGRAVIDRLPAGPWTLRVTTADGRSWSGSTETFPGAEVEIRLE